MLVRSYGLDEILLIVEMFFLKLYKFDIAVCSTTNVWPLPTKDLAL